MVGMECNAGKNILENGSHQSWTTNQDFVNREWCVEATKQTYREMVSKHIIVMAEINTTQTHRRKNHVCMMIIRGGPARQKGLNGAKFGANKVFSPAF